MVFHIPLPHTMPSLPGMSWCDNIHWITTLLDLWHWVLVVLNCFCFSVLRQIILYLWRDVCASFYFSLLTILLLQFLRPLPLIWSYLRMFLLKKKKQQHWFHCTHWHWSCNILYLWPKHMQLLHNIYVGPSCLPLKSLWHSHSNRQKSLSGLK